jgi:RNA polymerase subunit RPABC4/transcription elongation factor Spt4
LPGYMRPCRYCEKLIPPDANVCPLCGKVNPSGPRRCPQCASPVQKAWINCSSCGLSLELACRACGQKTFFGDYCEHCGIHLGVTCPNPKCRAEQPPLGENCIKCGKPLK